ncbi:MULTISPECIES: hypothetical protein [unclassified Blautia]|uniref:hypothetical protein n=1 Tax=unclassified Blautia TaxID=2648079 RepID=UPI003F8BD659
MIRFRNPGTQYTTQIQVFRELYKEYKDVPYFTLDDMAATIAKTKLMTAYGYAGDAALALSNTDNDSLNSTKMNAKMYAEVFRLLGWITSAGKGSYPLVFTYIGEHAACTDEVLPLYEQCVLGINNPQNIMDVKYDEKVRFFKAALFSLEDLDGIMYKHELCLGPMSIDDLDNGQYRRMISYIKGLRGSYKRYESAYQDLCDDLDVKPTLPDNSTRLPIAFMKTCNWIESKRTKSLYPPKSLECICLTEHGKEVAVSLHGMKDLRLDEYSSYSEHHQQSLIRLGVYSMLLRAGYNTEPVKDIMEKDTKECADILEGKQLLFSPYQTLHHEEVDEAIGIKKDNGKVKHSNKTILPSIQRANSKVTDINFDQVASYCYGTKDLEVTEFVKYVKDLKNKGLSKKRIIDKIFDDSLTDTQTRFYPFIAMLFRIMGLDCQASRPGDNGARWDAIIVDKNQSIPIEIKSPTEEQHLSLKAIRQALENKVILLSRKTHPTKPETTTLAVGYYLPNDRAEVTNLMNDFKDAYGYRIGVIDLKTLLTISITIILEEKTFDIEKLNRLEGFANATFD